MHLAPAALALAMIACEDDAVAPRPPAPPPSPCPTVDGPPEVARLSAGHSVTMAVMSDGTVRCWGENPSNRCCAEGAPGFFYAPARRSVGLECVTDVSIGESGGAAVRADGGLYVWSSDTNGQLTQYHDAPPGVPIRVPEVEPVVAVRYDGGSVHALRDDGSLWWWGAYMVTLTASGLRHQWDPAPRTGRAS